MSVTIEKIFNTGSVPYVLSSTASELPSSNLLKIVFTSTNIPDGSAAGTRSHTQPGGKYLGTWYESFDTMKKVGETQDYLSYPLSASECFYKTLTLVSGTLSLTTGAIGTFWHNYTPTASRVVTEGGRTYTVGFLGDTVLSGTAGTYSNAYFHYDDNTYGVIDSYSLRTENIGGTDYNVVDITFGTVTGSTVLSGTLDATTASGTEIQNSAQIYNKADNYKLRTAATDSKYLTPNNSVIFEVTFGEAYDCKLTAWDDDTHSTTENKILSEGHYRVDAVAYRYELNTTTLNSVNYVHYTFTSPGCFVAPPCSDRILKGDESYYGVFDMVYATTQHGECLSFKPRLHDMNDSFIAGNYDFVTTLHYQYT